MSLDPLSVPLEDEELLGEIQLLTELILAATHRTDDALDQVTIDRALGLGDGRPAEARALGDRSPEPRLRA